MGNAQGRAVHSASPFVAEWGPHKGESSTARPHLSPNGDSPTDGLWMTPTDGPEIRDDRAHAQMGPTAPGPAHCSPARPLGRGSEREGARGTTQLPMEKIEPGLLRTVVSRGF